MSAFHINSFPELFGYSALKKGEQIFLSGRVKYCGKDEQGYSVYSAGGRDLWLQRRGGQVLKSKCECGREFCAHLASVVFFLADEGKEQGKAAEKQRMVSFSSVYRRFRAFLSEASKGENHKTLIKRFSEKCSVDPVISSLCLYCYTLLSSDQKISGVPQLAKRTNRRQKQYFHEAVIFLLEKPRFKKFSSIVILLSFFLDSLGMKGEIDELLDLLEKKPLRKSNPSLIDEVAVCRFILQMRLKSLTRKGSGGFHLSAESVIAQSEYELMRGNIEKAMTLLKSGHDRLLRQRPSNFFAFLERAVQMTERTKNAGMEAFLISSLLKNDPVISPEKLKRLEHILPSEILHQQLAEIAENLKKKDAEVYGRSLLEILAWSKNWKEIFLIASRERIPFSLVTETVIRLLPQRSDQIFKVYSRQLLQAISLAREPYHQEKLFDLVKSYLEKLPENAAVQLCDLLLEQISRNNYICRLLENEKAQLSEAQISHRA